MTDESRSENQEQGETGIATADPDQLQPSKLKQTVEMRDVGPCKKHIRVEIERDAIDKLLDMKFSELVTDAKVPGFRPGKAPRKVIERRFQKEIGDQVKAEVLLQSLQQLADEHDVAPLSTPNLDPTTIDIPRSGPLIYEFEVEVRPQFDLPLYRGMKLKKPVKVFTDADLDEEERRVLAPHSSLVPKPQGNAAIGDVLVVDVVFKDGERVLSEWKDTTIRLERRATFKDGVAERFAEQVAGVSVGESRTFDVVVSHNAADESIAGKTIRGEMKVLEVKAMRKPELTPEFLGEFGVHTVEQFRERMRVNLERRLDYVQRQTARYQILSQIAAAATWDLPRDLLARQARNALNRRVMEMRANGIPEEEILARQRLLTQDVLRSTALALKEHFVLQKIAEVEKIEVTEEEIQDEIDRLAYTYNESPRRLRARLEKEEMMEALAIELIERKVLDLILGSAEWEEVPIDTNDVDSSMTAIEHQVVPGIMRDPAAEPSPKSQS
jgi:trigger factor